MSGMTVWRSDVFLPMCHAYIKVKIKVYSTGVFIAISS